MILKYFKAGTIGLLLLASLPASAAKFANQFVEFELPPQWQCTLEGAEWVCQSTNEDKKRDAIIVLAAKLRGDQDSLDRYLDYLKNPKMFTSVQNKQLRSEIKYAKTVSINNQAWVDALHLDSEIPGFYTRYLATVKQDIGVLVTYSINKLKYQQYLADFENMVATLKVFRKAGGINIQKPDANLLAPNIPQLETTSVFPGTNPQGGNDAPAPKPKDSGLPLLPILVIGGAVGYIVWRKRQSAK